MFDCVLCIVLVFVLIIRNVSKGKQEHSAFYESTFLDTSHENSSVTVKYPQINDENYRTVNELIKNFAENIASDTYGSDYVNLNLDASYRIAYNDNELLSIVFEVQGYVSTTAHPNQFLSAINVNLSTETIISLSDLYSIEDGFVEVIDNDFHEQFTPKKLEEWGIKSDDASYEELKNKLFSVSVNVQTVLFREECFYLSENAVIICVGIPHAIGDYFEIEVEYSELSDFLKTNGEPS